MTAAIAAGTADPTEPVPAAASRPLAELDTGRHWDSLPARPLERAELLELAASVAARPELWRDDAVPAAAGEHRHYTCLHRDEHVDVWLLCWTPGDDTGWHDHDVSSGAVAVASGHLVEHNLAVGAPCVDTEVTEGHAYVFGPEHIHRVTGGGDWSVSVHAYSPPLGRMGQYSVGTTGVLRRLAVTWADELQAL